MDKVNSLNVFFQSGAIVLFSIVLFVIILAVVTLFIVITQKDKKVVSGSEMMIGMIGIAKTKLDPEGDVFINSELWRAKSLGEVIEKGEKVKVCKINGLLLTVEKVNEKGD